MIFKVLRKDEGLAKEGKSYNVKNNVGSSKYVINFHNGIKKHNDGSNFYDIKTFKNIPDLNNFEKELKSKGFDKRRRPSKRNWYCRCRNR